MAVTDGFTGNVLLKSSEAVAKLITDVLRQELTSSLRTKMGALLAKPAFHEAEKPDGPLGCGRGAAAGHRRAGVRRPRSLGRPRHAERHSHGAPGGAGRPFERLAGRHPGETGGAASYGMSEPANTDQSGGLHGGLHGTAFFRVFQTRKV